MAEEGKTDDLDGQVSYGRNRLRRDRGTAFLGAGRAPRHDSNRILRETTAKRAIVALCADELKSRKAGTPRGWADALKAALAPLVTVCSDHPDYDRQWTASDRSPRRDDSRRENGQGR